MGALEGSKINEELLVKKCVINNLKIFLDYKYMGTKLTNTSEGHDEIRR